MRVLVIGIAALVIIGSKRGVRLHIKQSSDHLDPIPSDPIGEEVSMADAMEAGRQNVDQKATDELICG